MDSAIFSAQAFAFARANEKAVDDLLGRAKPDGGGDTAFNLIPAVGDPTRVWAEVDAATESASGRGAGPSFHTDTSGLSGGGDLDVGGGNRVGLSLGYDRDTLHDGDAGSAAGDIFRLSAYASQPAGLVGFSEVVSYAKAWNTTDRPTGVTPARASYTSSELTGAVQIAAPFTTGGVTVSPAAGLQVSQLSSSRFSESDPGFAAFAVKGSGQSTTFASPYASVGFSQAFTSGGGIVFIPDVSVGYRYDQTALGQRFTLTAADATVFQGNRVGLQGSSGLFGLSLTAHHGQWTAYAKYQAQFASGWSDQSGAIGFRIAF